MLTCAAAPYLALHSQAAAALEGGSVTQGAANITQTDKLTTIKQTSDRALIDWRGFDLAPDEAAKFIQPSASSLTVNRVNSVNPTTIQGKISANGNIVLLNPNGVMFSGTSQVDVNGIVATTSTIRDADFAAGKLDFKAGGNPNAAVVNAGTISAKDAGLVGLVAPNAINSGVINAKLGKVQLASGDTYTLDLAGNGIINLEVSDAVKQQVVANAGAIAAAGGTIQLTAAAGREVVNSLILASGSLNATSVAQKNGKIIISAEGSNAVKGNDAAKKGKKSGESVVLVDGVVNASGRKTGEKGGSVEITGDYVAINDGAFIDASGDTGGGDIKIGGDYLGTGTTATAIMTAVGKDAIIANDAVTNGDGGRTIVWSDDTTEFHGNIFGRGGAQGGNGGFVETSGKKYLDAQGFVDLTASKGNKGQYLLDPTNIAIYGNVNPTFTSTDGTSINLANGLAMWLDPNDRSKIQLTYYNTAAETYTGVAGSNTVTSTVNTDGTAIYRVGSRIRIGAGGTALASDPLGADTYTVASVAVVGGKTVITTVEALTSNYASQTLYRGVVSQWNDKSTFANNATQAGAAMPLWVGGRMNGKDVIYFDGINDFMTVADAPSLDNTNGLTLTLAHSPLINNVLSAIISKRTLANDNTSYTVFIYTGNSLYLDIIGNTDRFNTGSYPGGTNNIFSIVYDGTLANTQRVKVYDKGTLVATATESSSSIPDYSSNLYLGQMNASDNRFSSAEYQ
ncbi:MAG: filamentous hemagglutinin N-terminal domain-containing protein, partial [Alphaproteobacteria bacterium]|nr:filamentous hemagglutinin N-terminal domain-containing protein [Alphaproteobacteria bacterium]